MEREGINLGSINNIRIKIAAENVIREDFKSFLLSASNESHHLNKGFESLSVLFVSNDKSPPVVVSGGSFEPPEKSLFGIFLILLICDRSFDINFVNIYDSDLKAFNKRM